MSDKPHNFELDDELLSAYLDGELSADERAAVEARLAVDPAAQQLLHELRMVSQSVQAIPTASLGRDLSEEIIRRARVVPGAPDADVVRGSPDPARSSDRRSPETFIDAMPKIKIFGSRRAWIWASLALAAGLLIMIVQSGDESNKKLPQVAVLNQDRAKSQPTDEAAESTRRQISISAAPKSQSAPPTTVASDRELQDKQIDALGGAMPAVPAASEPRGVQLGAANRGDMAAGPPAAASAAPKTPNKVAKDISQLGDDSGSLTASPEQVASDKSAPTLQPAGRLSGAAGTAGMPAEKQKSESVVGPTAQPLYFVHVVATPDALKKGSFDRLLADNKIEFVPQPMKKQRLTVGGGLREKPAEIESRTEDQSNKAAESHTLKTEVVLVEAPAPAIESCLADLNKNANDFVSIAVNEELQSRDRFDAKSAVSKPSADSQKNLSRFNRGAAPDAAKDTNDLRKYFYSSELDKPDVAATNGSPRAGGFGGGEADKIAAYPADGSGAKEKEWYYKNPPAEDIRRARSIAPWGIDSGHAGDVATAAGRRSRSQPAQSGAEATNQPMAQRTPVAQPEAKADNQNNNLKVLFVFTTEERPAPSSKADNRQK